MKHTTVILLLALLLLQTGGYYIVSYADILEARQEAQNYINHTNEHSDNVTTLTLPLCDGKVAAAGFTYTDLDEFTYQGRMYDVISSEKGKDQITFKCYTDSKETRLNQNLCDKIDSDRDAPSQQQKGNSLAKMLFQVYTKTKQDVYCFCQITLMGYLPSDNNRQQFYTYQAIISPPPEFICA